MIVKGRHRILTSNLYMHTHTCTCTGKYTVTHTNTHAYTRIGKKRLALLGPEVSC